ncbi:MAG: tRNA (adenosine(37)-N6)-threonylcarbamoyltransferase complex ATPase subunit type 1 TsaE [Clostridiales Family XIII bacterium]|jgi:tRNA threonylcarbamoyladenosine biosynthesis protein TsaE|nr:tRNA (adenosine(37)-N6)-threonylcarbamoyltransferase complex ATPase subunit type 1 TsaE [Clostridiales Family XIII bacterium]
MNKRIVKNEEETREFGLELAAAASAGQIIALTGGLGTGKTTLTKAIGEGLGIKAMITSPTYTIIHEYQGGRLPLYHFDVYRIDGADDMYELGFEEYFYGGGLTVVEWADRIPELLPPDALRIKIDFMADAGRIYTY